METFHLSLLLVLAFVFQSYGAPVREKRESIVLRNETRTNSSKNVTEVKVAVKKEDDGPSNILYTVCSGYVGINSREVIKDAQMSASSTLDGHKLLKFIDATLSSIQTNKTSNATARKTKSNYTITGNMTAAHDGRLGNPSGSWCASDDGFNAEHYLVIDLGEVKILEGVLTQGRSDSDNWVTEYTVAHSSDKKSWNVVQKDGRDMIFKGNKDRDSVAVGSFPNRIAARFIKFLPKSHHGKLKCMRVEVIGCDPDDVNVAKNQPTKQSSTKHNFTSSKAVDGHFVDKPSTDTCAHTHRENSPWLRVDLRRVYHVKEIFISNHDHRAGRDLRDFEIRVGKSLENEGNNNALCSSLQTVEPGQIKTVACKNGTSGRYINIRIPRSDSTLSLCEVAVLGVAETIVKLGLEDIASRLKTGVITDKTGEAKEAIGGLLGQLQGQLGGAMLSQLQGQGMGMLKNLQGQGLGMLRNLQGQGLGMLKDVGGQGLEMANKLQEQGKEMAEKAKKQALEMADKFKKKGMEMMDNAKKQAMEMADKAKKQAMEAADKAKKQGMEAADKAKKQAMEAADNAKKQGMAMVGDMQGQMNQQQDKFKKKLKEILKKGKEFLKIGQEEADKFKKKGYIETGKKYLDVAIGMAMAGVSHIQAKLMESMGNIAGDMTKQITTFSEYDTSDIKGLLDDVDPVPVREFVQEAKPKIADYMDEMQRLAKKYLEIGIEKGKEAKDEIESEAQSTADQATGLGKNVAGKASSMGKNMANKAKEAGMKAVDKAKATGMDAMNKAKSMGMDAVNKAKDAGMGAVNKAKSMGMDAVNKAKSMGMDAVNKAKSMGMGALNKAKGVGMGAFNNLKQTGMGALGQVRGLGTGMLGKLSGAGKELLKKAEGKSSQLKQMQQIQMLQQLKQMKKMEELQKQMEEEQDIQWKKFEELNKEIEGEEGVLKDNMDKIETKVEELKTVTPSP